MHEVLVNRVEGLSLPRKSVVRLTDGPDMTLDVYRGRKTTIQQQQQSTIKKDFILFCSVLFRIVAARDQCERRTQCKAIHYKSYTALTVV